jgi:internalin A
MRNSRYLWLTLALVLCADRASADKDRVVEAFERLGAVVKRDDAQRGKPVLALRFGLRNPIPETIPELDRDVLLIQLQPRRLGTPLVARLNGTNADQENGGKPLHPSVPAAIKVTDGDLKEVSKLVHLQVLDLSCSEITNDGLQHVTALKHLHTLDLRNTKVDDAGLQILKNLKNLKRLYLTNCPVTDKGLVHLSELTNLEELFLRGGEERVQKGEGCSYPLPGDFEVWYWKNEVTDKGLGPLKKLRNLKKLYLNGRQLTDEGLPELCELTDLRELTLDVTELTDEGLKHLSGFKQLEKLSLEFTKVTDEGLKHLVGLKRLEILDLAGTRVTDEGMKTLEQLKNLRQLSLAFTRVTDKGLEKLNRFERLEHVDLPGPPATAANGKAKAMKALPKLQFGPIYRLPDWYEKFCQQRQARFQQQELPAMMQAWQQQQSVPEGYPLYSPPAWLKFLQDHPVLGLALAVWVISVAIWVMIRLGKGLGGFRQK